MKIQKLILILLISFLPTNSQHLDEFDSTKLNFLVPMDGISDNISKIPSTDWKALIIKRNKTILKKVDMDVTAQNGPELGSLHIGYKRMPKNDINNITVMFLLHHHYKGKPYTCYINRDNIHGGKFYLDTTVNLLKKKYQLLNRVIKRNDSIISEVEIRLRNINQTIFSHTFVQNRMK